MKENLCPCGTGLNYTSCCLPVLNDHQQAATAEMLMRSRYTAFVMQNVEHILLSWHIQTRPRNLNFDDHPVVWLGLKIRNCRDGQARDSTGIVDFISYYLENGQLCTLEEESQFVKEGDFWFYLRGECKVKKEKVARNTTCPCGSGLKFKRCCLSK
ncbi:MAG: YchJ family metal-binding protein [Desulforhopalus sp.]